MLGPLRFHLDSNVILLQFQSKTNDISSSAVLVKTLRVDLKDGSVKSSMEVPLSDSAPVVLGIIGMLNLHGGSVIAFASKAKQVRDYGMSLPDKAQHSLLEI